MWDFLVLFLKIIRYKALNPAIIMAIKKAISILINGKNKPAQNTQKTQPSSSAKKVASTEKTSENKAEKTAKTQNTKNDKKIAKKPEPVNQKAMKITADIAAASNKLSKKQ